MLPVNVIATEEDTAQESFSCRVKSTTFPDCSGVEVKSKINYKYSCKATKIQITFKRNTLLSTIAAIRLMIMPFVFFSGSFVQFPSNRRNWIKQKMNWFPSLTVSFNSITTFLHMNSEFVFRVVLSNHNSADFGHMHAIAWQQFCSWLVFYELILNVLTFICRFLLIELSWYVILQQL